MQVCADGDLGGGCGSDGTGFYIYDKYQDKKDQGVTTYWEGLTAEERNALTNNGWNADVWKDAIGGPGVTKADPIHDPLVWALSLFGVGRLALVSTGLETIGTTYVYCQTTQCQDDLVKLYRSVGPKEFEDIMNSKIFRPDPSGRSMDTKWFWEQLSSAQGFVKQFPDLSYTVSITIPKSVIDLGYRVRNLDNLGPAVSYIDDSLDAFNNAIISIESVLFK